MGWTGCRDVPAWPRLPSVGMSWSTATAPRAPTTCCTECPTASNAHSARPHAETGARIDALMRRQALVTASIAVATLGAFGGATVADSPAFALAAGLAATVTGLVSFARWWRLGDRRTALTATDAHNTWQMSRFSRWLVARAHQATVRATEADGGPADTADRMAESLYQFTGDMRTLERINRLLLHGRRHLRPAPAGARLPRLHRHPP